MDVKVSVEFHPFWIADYGLNMFVPSCEIYEHQDNGQDVHAQSRVDKRHGDRRPVGHLKVNDVF